MFKLSKWALAATPAVATLTPGLAWAQQGFGYGPRMMWSGGNWGYGMFLGPVFLVLILIIAVAGVMVVIRWLGPSSHGQIHHHHLSTPPKMPLDILKERFARGEIDKDEFEERRRILGD